MRRLTTSPGIDTNPAWSPNGSEIAFTSSRSGSPQIYVMDAEGANLRRVTFEGDYNDGAAWSPDGTRIAYATRAQRNRFDIAVIDLVTLATQRRSPTAAAATRRRPSRRTAGAGLRLDQRRRRQIFVMEARGGRLRQLTFEGENRVARLVGLSCREAPAEARSGCRPRRHVLRV